MVLALALVAGGGMGGCMVEAPRADGFGPGGVVEGSSGEDSGEDSGGFDEESAGSTSSEPEGDTTGDEPPTGSTGGGEDDLECPVVGGWTASSPFGDGDDVSHPLPSFAVGSWFYVHTLTGGDRILWSAMAGPDGALGPWQVASGDHGGGPHGYTALAIDDAAYHFRNGHIARYVLDEQGYMQGDVDLIEDDPDQAFGGDKFVWDSAVLVSFDQGARWVFHLGGFSFGPYDYRRTVRRSAVPLQPRFDDTGVEHPAGRPGKAAAYVPAGSSTGWIVTGEAGGSGLWRIEVDADGSLGGWEELPSLPAGTGNERGDLFVAGRSLFAVRGSTVLRAVFGADGSLSEWTALPSLPEDAVDVHWGDGHGEGAAWGRIGDTIYLTGPRSVFHASLEPGACD